MTDAMDTGEEQLPDEELDPDTLAAELGLGIDLSDEEREAADAMVARLREQFPVDEGGPEAEEPEPEVNEAPEAEPEVEPEPVAAQAPAPRGVVVVDGIEVPVEEAVAYLTKREAQRQAEQIKPEPTPEPPKPPEWLDQDDPAQVAMWQRQVQLETQVSQLGQNQQREAQERVRAQAVADATSGISTFRTLHPELSEEDITTLRTHAVSLDIIDGLTRTRSGPDAIAKALDIAYWDHPEYRARATAAPSPAKVKAEERAERKSKLNALGGSSGSVQRQEAKPDLSDDRTARKAAAQWLTDQGIL